MDGGDAGPKQTDEIDNKCLGVGVFVRAHARMHACTWIGLGLRRTFASLLRSAPASSRKKIIVYVLVVRGEVGGQDVAAERGWYVCRGSVYTKRGVFCPGSGVRLGGSLFLILRPFADIKAFFFARRFVVSHLGASSGVFLSLAIVVRPRSRVGVGGVAESRVDPGSPSFFN